MTFWDVLEFPVKAVGIGTMFLAGRHLLAMLIWPRIIDAVRFYESLPLGFRHRHPAPDIWLRTCQNGLWAMALAFFLMPPLSAGVMAFDGRASGGLLAVALVSVAATGLLLAVDRRLLPFWRRSAEARRG